MKFESIQDVLDAIRSDPREEEARQAAHRQWASIAKPLDSLLAQCADLVVVSNEVFTSGEHYADGTGEYMRLVAGVNRALARRADRVCEVICGLPQYYKGAAG